MKRYCVIYQTAGECMFAIPYEGKEGGKYTTFICNSAIKNGRYSPHTWLDRYVKARCSYVHQKKFLDSRRTCLSSKSREKNSLLPWPKG